MRLYIESLGALTGWLGIAMVVGFAFRIGSLVAGALWKRYFQIPDAIPVNILPGCKIIVPHKEAR